MEPFKVHILGCGSALPTLKHFPSSQVVEVRGKLFMVDCGEGAQIQLRKTRISFSKIRCVFISHLHGDHCFGLIGLISTFGMLGRTVPLHVYAPEEFGPMLHAQLEVIYEDKSLSVETIPLSHRVPCCGFLFREKPGRRHILREMIDCYEIPISQIDNIKSGMDWTTSDGRVIPNSRLTTDPSPSRSYAYCSDTRYVPSLHTLVERVNLLYHESTYDKACVDRARLYYHSTAEQAAMVARDAHVGQLLLGHFSARYNDEEHILNEARALFSNTYLAREGEEYLVK